MADTALVIVARYPEAGKTKTRLASAIGAQEAADLYRAFLTDLARRFSGSDIALHWAFTPPEVDYAAFVATLAPALAQHMTCFPQQGADFNTRLHNVFKWTSNRHYSYTVLIGSDSPHIGREIVAQARSALNEADVVLGPADDGGYYLIAMCEPHNVFSGIPMSTDVVLQMTIELAQRQGLSVRLLDTLFDIDEWPDLQRLTQLLEANSTLAPETAAHIATKRSLYDNYIRS
jgi:rSAM/selenodomain-associated transferase 1